mgnify:CR=1 FL=1
MSATCTVTPQAPAGALTGSEACPAALVVKKPTKFGALIQAFRGLVRELLTESEPHLAAWRDSLSTALGSQGGVLAAVIQDTLIPNDS